MAYLKACLVKCRGLCRLFPLTRTAGSTGLVAEDRGSLLPLDLTGRTRAILNPDSQEEFYAIVVVTDFPLWTAFSSLFEGLTLSNTWL